MCEFRIRQNFLNQNQIHRIINDPFKSKIQTRFPYHGVREGHCPSCHNLIPLEKRFPSGHTSRSLCQVCYLNLIGSRPNTDCFICLEPLPAYKLQAQMAAEREIKEYIHDGDCLDYFTIVHCKVVGENQDYIENSSYSTPQLPFHNRQVQILPIELQKSVDELKKTINASLSILNTSPGNVPVQHQNNIPTESINDTSESFGADDGEITVINLPKNACKTI